MVMYTRKYVRTSTMSQHSGAETKIWVPIYWVSLMY